MTALDTAECFLWAPLSWPSASAWALASMECPTPVTEVVSLPRGRDELRDLPKVTTAGKWGSRDSHPASLSAQPGAKTTLQLRNRPSAPLLALCLSEGYCSPPQGSRGHGSHPCPPPTSSSCPHPAITNPAKPLVRLFPDSCYRLNVHEMVKDKEAGCTIVHGAEKSQTGLSNATIATRQSSNFLIVCFGTVHSGLIPSDV